MSSQLELEGIKVHFRTRTGLMGFRDAYVLNDVDIQLRPRETVALVGESGSGKTTLGRVALRLLTPKTGRVIFDGTDITHWPEAKLKTFRRRVQAIFQDPFSSLDPYMSIQSTLEEPLLIHGIGSKNERNTIILNALREVRLTPEDEYVSKYPHMLSGGQRQRIAIARALLVDPVVLIADEPVSMIDASSRMEILRLLQDIQASRGMAILYITHDLATALHFADRVAVMYAGRIVEAGSTSQVLRTPKHPYTMGLLRSVPTADPANRLRDRPVIEGEPPNPTALPSGCHFHLRCPEFIANLCENSSPALEIHVGDHSIACHLYSAERPRKVSYVDG